jgi:DNA-binding HxlR family transcriptional regulator
MAIGDVHRERAACPLYTAIGVIEGRWKPMLFQRLSWRAHGFGELRRSMPGVSAKVLRQQLREMMADGLVARRSLAPAHLGVRYALTRYGRSLAPVFDVLWRWGRRHVSRRDAHAGTLVTAPRVASEPADPPRRGAHA